MNDTEFKAALDARFTALAALPRTEIRRRCGHIETLICAPGSEHAKWAKRQKCLQCKPMIHIYHRCGCDIEHPRDLSESKVGRQNMSESLCFSCSMA